MGNWTRIARDSNGNTRFVTSWLGYGFPNYEAAIHAANAIGGRKYHNKSFGGGLVFQAYESELPMLTKKLQEAGGMKSNPSGMYGYDESDEAVELFLFAQNDRDLYRQQTLPIIENLKKKIAKGKYDKTLAVKLWRDLADNAAKKYTFEHGTTSASNWQSVKGFGVFTVAMRNGAARLLEDYYASEALGLRQENPKRRKRSTPIKRTNISKRKYVSRPSQITGEAPTRRLKKRRTLAESGPAGYFPNPAKKIKNQPATLAGSGVAVYFDSELGEYQVRIAGKPKATYFTDDKADALATAQHMRNTMLGTRRANPVKKTSTCSVEINKHAKWEIYESFTSGNKKQVRDLAIESARRLAKHMPTWKIRVIEK